MKIYKVTTKNSETYFTSLSAIFTKWTERQLGVTLAELYGANATAKGYQGVKCTITIHECHRMAQRKK